MAIAVILDLEGANLDQYDHVLGKLSYEPGGKGEPGGLFHWVMATDDGVRVTDVWESREAFETFTQKLIPVMAEIGLPRPEPMFYDVHNYLTAG